MDCNKAKEEDEGQEVTPKKKVETWEVRLVVIDENQPPKKVIVNNKTEETLDLYVAIAKILNKLDELGDVISG